MLHPLRLAALSHLQSIETFFDACFGARANPWRHLGALGFLLFWIIAASGVYLYAVLDTSVEGAYRSIDHLSRAQWYFGGVVRSLHRYASDAFVLVMFLHVLRELVYGRSRGFRWFSWVSGVPLVWLTFAAGVGGFWLVWDSVAQFSAIATMEWLDRLRMFADPLTRNFLAAGSVNDRLFSLFVFLHIGLPLLLLLGLWIHIQRISWPQTSPSRALSWGTLVSLLALCLAAPVRSAAPADLTTVAPSLALDWFYLAPHALMYATSPGSLWVLVVGTTVALVTLPWWKREARPPVAHVDAANCNGCQRCVADCPYAAITMQPENPVHPRAALAVVDPDLCASCGICAGSCPSATPFRSLSALVTGIDMPQLPIDAMRTQLKSQLARLTGKANVVLIGCARAVDVRAWQGTDTATLSLICSGQLPPAFVEYALRNGADGVLVTGCGECDCAFRLGNEWTEQRLRGAREPHLRANVRNERVRIVWASARQSAKLESGLVEFRAALYRLEPGKAEELDDA
jgi:coenzyme F420-reducing hydrogenase delta subunit/ferredoxin